MRKPTDRILVLAANNASKANGRRKADQKKAEQAFKSAIIHLEELLLALQAIAPEGEGNWFFTASFKDAIAKCEKLNDSRRFKEAWALAKELKSELQDCLTEAPKFAPAPEPEVLPPTLTNRQRKQAKKSMACKARNERLVKGETDVVLSKEGGKTVARPESPLRAALRAVMAA